MEAKYESDEEEIVFPLRRAFSVDDDFFAWGDNGRYLTSKFGLVTHDPRAAAAGEEDAALDIESPRFECGIKGCTKVFSSLKEVRLPLYALAIDDAHDSLMASLRQFEKHYHAAHQFQCNECSKIFLSARLLDIHISETHDSFFRAMAERRPMYVCLAEGCTETFKNADARQRHLVCDHHYPKSYDFHNPFRLREKHREKARSKAQARERKAIPCAFYNTRKGCRNGEQCPFLHAAPESSSTAEAAADAPAGESKHQAPENVAAASMDIADQVDSLASALENTHIWVPDEVTFGRRTGGRTRRMR